jgi:hypothetical protein
MQAREPTWWLSDGVLTLNLTPELLRQLEQTAQAATKLDLSGDKTIVSVMAMPDGGRPSVRVTVLLSDMPELDQNIKAGDVLFARIGEPPEQRVLRAADADGIRRALRRQVQAEVFYDKLAGKWRRELTGRKS